ncbi:MAG TPA: class 1 fructose-bisphosphatase, partial [Rubricoccaceae bacterium]
MSATTALPDVRVMPDGLSGGTSFKTLEQFIIERQDEVPGSKGQFSRLLRDIGVAAKIVDRDVRKAGLVDLFGDTGDVNVQDEIQKKLDLLAHEEYVRALRRGGEVCLIGSEEHAEAIPLFFEGCQGKYVVLFDPLEGSSNIDVNVSIGTIFSVYQIPDDHVGHVTVASALQCGRQQVAAGYVIYGSSTMLVYTTGAGVNGFTLDPSIGEFLLSHPDIRTPETGQMYSVNEGNYNSWSRGLKEYIKWMQTEDAATNRPYTTRYIGSFVADFHRNLIKGGIYIYPSNARSPEGKLRLMYEANPLAFIVEQAGGMASTGTGPVLDVE